MLVIKQQQIVLLNKKSLEQFVEYASVYLRGRFPKKTKSFGNNELQTHILAGVDRAEMHGIDDEADVIRFLEVSIRFGLCFDEELDWAREILTRSNSNTSSKLAALDDYQLFVIDLSSSAIEEF